MTARPELAQVGNAVRTPADFTGIVRDVSHGIATVEQITPPGEAWRSLWPLAQLQVVAAVMK